MDEPFSALDALMNLRMRNELLQDSVGRASYRRARQLRHVEEAIHLADRIIVLSSRPATLKAAFDVPFPHPRNFSTPGLKELKVAILRELGVDTNADRLMDESRAS